MGHSRAVALALFVLDIIAFGLAIGAETRRSHAAVTTTSSTDASITYCKYSKDAATGLGIASFIFLLLGQTLVTTVTKCLCCSAPLRPGGRRALAILFFVLSWFSFFIAEVFLIGGASRAAYRTRFSSNNRVQNYNCETLRQGIFVSAAAFALITLVLVEAYYWCFCKASDKNWDAFSNTNAATYGANPYSPYNPGPFTQAPPYGVPYPSAPPGQTIGMATYPPRV